MDTIVVLALYAITVLECIDISQTSKGIKNFGIKWIKMFLLGFVTGQLIPK